MPDEDSIAGDLVPRSTGGMEAIVQFERALLERIDSLGLPVEGVLVEVEQRQRVFTNVDDALELLDLANRTGSIYLSKMLAAVASGLFDAALNYLWDETISELRARVVRYDLSYFFDLAVQSPDRRKGLSSSEDIRRVDDNDLIRAANEMGLVSDVGRQQLDLIRYMRNWASAAHPNQNQLTAFQILDWLETCIREVITLPLSNVVVEIKKLLANIKENKIDPSEARTIANFFDGLSDEQADNLAAGLFGIYTQESSDVKARDNVRLLLPYLWATVSDDQRSQFGSKYARFVANNDQAQAELARELLDLVDAAAYLPEDIRAAEIENALDALLAAHHGIDNFYNEPVVARQLLALVGQRANVPSQVVRRYVMTLVEVFLTNGHGVAWNAEPIYRELIEGFDTEQARIALTAFTDKTVAGRLQLRLPSEKFLELHEIVRRKLTGSRERALAEAIVEFTGPLSKLKDDSRIKRLLEPFSRS